MKRYPHLYAILRKKNRVLRWTFLVSLVVFLVGAVVGYVIEQRSLPEAIPLNSAIISDAKDEWCYVDVSFMSDYFASYEEDNVEKHRYYFVWDDNYLYVALLTKSMETNELADVHAYSMDETGDVKAPTPVRIYGMTEAMPDDLKTIAMDQLNEWYGEGSVTEDNFGDICGNVLLNVKENPNTTVSVYPMIAMGLGGLMALIFGLILVIYYFQSSLQLRKMNPEDLEDIDGEIASDTADHMEGLNIYLTKRYVVDLTYRLRVVPYEDIYWLYMYRVRSYGATTSVAMKLGLSNGKIKDMGNSSRKYEQDIQEMMLRLAQRCPDVLIGYTKENRKAFKQRVKGI